MGSRSASPCFGRSLNQFEPVTGLGVVDATVDGHEHKRNNVPHSRQVRLDIRKIGQGRFSAHGTFAALDSIRQPFGIG